MLRTNTDPEEDKLPLRHAARANTLLFFLMHYVMKKKDFANTPIGN
jgi:hypothetical protein